MEKDEEGKELICQSREQEQEYKEGIGNIYHFERWKRMFKSKPSEFNLLVKLPKRSSFTHQEMDDWWADEIFIEKYSDESSQDLDDEVDIKNSTNLNKQFRIIISELDGNWLFHTVNNEVIGRQSSASDMRSKIWHYLEKKKEVYRAFCEWDIKIIF